MILDMEEGTLRMNQEGDKMMKDLDHEVEEGLEVIVRIEVDMGGLTTQKMMI